MAENNLTAYANLGPGTSTPYWLNKGDNAWQMIAATLVGFQSVPGLVILYGSYVKKKWAVNSAFMALYAFAMTLIVWVLFAYKMSFGSELLPIWGKAGTALSQSYQMQQAILPATAISAGRLIHSYYSSQPPAMMSFPMATMVYFQFVFAAITVILLGGSLLGRMNIYAWFLFVPVWVACSYSVVCFSIWGGGFLYQRGLLDYSGGYVIHVSSGTAGLTAAYWVGPRLKKDRDEFPPNNLLLMLAGSGMLWLGWSGFNGGDPFAANIDASMAVINTHICTATSLLVWLFMDIKFLGRTSVIGAVQGMITGLVCITPAAGLVEGWAAIVMGILSGTIPWYTLNKLHKNTVLRRIDDTMAVFHTHAVAGALGGICAGIFAEPTLCNLFYVIPGYRGLAYTWKGNGGQAEGAKQLGWQLIGIIFVTVWNVVVTSLICVVIKGCGVPLRMSDEDMEIGDDAVHGEEAYAVWGEGEFERSAHDGSAYGNRSSGGMSSDVITPGNGASTEAPSMELSQFSGR